MNETIKITIRVWISLRAIKANNFHPALWPDYAITHVVACVEHQKILMVGCVDYFYKP